MNLGEARDKSSEFAVHRTHSLYLQYLQIKNFILKAPDKKTFEIISEIGWQRPHFNEYKMSILLTYFVIF